MRPVVADLPAEERAFDDFGGGWGDRKELDMLLQAYARVRGGATSIIWRTSDAEESFGGRE